jgi:hypothetical protein
MMKRWHEVNLLFAELWGLKAGLHLAKIKNIKYKLR